MSATANRMLTGSHWFETVRASVDYSSHPVSGAGRWTVTLRRAGMRTATLVRPYSHRDGGGLDVTRAILRKLFPAAVIEHKPDTVTGYRFELYAPSLEEAQAIHGEIIAGRADVTAWEGDK